jgi:hypothetical protein
MGLLAQILGSCGTAHSSPAYSFPLSPGDLVPNLASNAGYNQIFMAKEDMSKIVFHYPGFIDLYEWVVMTFGLKMPVQHIKGL